MTNQNLLWPYRPNWKEGVRETFEYRTEILTSRSGKEQRRALRATPRRSFEWETLVRPTQRFEFARTILSAQEAAKVIAHPAQWTTCASISDVSTNLTVVEEMPWIEAEAYLVLSDLDGMSLVRVVSYSHPTVTLEDPPHRAFAAGSKVHLGLLGRISESSSATWETNQVARHQLRFDAAPGPNPAPWPGSLTPSFGSREIWFTKPNWAAPPEVAYEVARELIDFGFGRVEHHETHEIRARTLRLTYLGRDREEVNEAIGNFVRMLGQRGEFYGPTWLHELPVHYPLVSGQSIIRFDGTAYRDAYVDDVVNKAVCIALVDGTFLTRTISGWSTSGSESRITVSGAWGANVATDEILSIMFMPLWRLATDSLTIEWLTDQVAQYSMTLRSLESLSVET
jgi:hypothetical protein